MVATKGYAERPITLVPIVGASFALWLGRSLWDAIRKPAPGRHGVEVPALPEIALEPAFDRKKPVVFRGTAAAWPVFGDYQPEQVREKYGTEKTSALLSTSTVFTRETPRAATEAGLLAEQLPLRVGVRSQSSATGRVWMGQAGDLTPLRNEPWHGLLVQLHGSERVRLFAPDEYKNVYGRIPRDIADTYTDLPADEFDPDMDSYPRLRNASSYDVVLDPGDMLYIPVFWWHQVESVDASISYVARYNPRYLEFARAAFFPQTIRSVLRAPRG